MILPIKNNGHLLKYDSIHGVLPHKVGSDEKGILVEEKHFMFFQRNFKFTFESLDINYVIEATGKYKTFEDLNAHNRRSEESNLISSV
jgi:glyceraldehyde 3-phosphate dehydrogenase